MSKPLLLSFFELKFRSSIKWNDSLIEFYNVFVSVSLLLDFITKIYSIYCFFPVRTRTDRIKHKTHTNTERCYQDRWMYIDLKDIWRKKQYPRVPFNIQHQLTIIFVMIICNGVLSAGECNFVACFALIWFYKHSHTLRTHTLDRESISWKWNQEGR